MTWMVAYRQYSSAAQAHFFLCGSMATSLSPGEVK